MNTVRLLLTEIDRIDRHGTSLPERVRSQLVAELRRSLIDPDRLEFYLRELVQHCRARYNQALPEENMQLVLRKSLAAFGDRALVQFALNPIALCQLHNHLSCDDVDDMPYWAELMCEEELARRGLRLADLDAALEKAFPSEKELGAASSLRPQGTVLPTIASLDNSRASQSGDSVLALEMSNGHAGEDVIRGEETTIAPLSQAQGNVLMTIVGLAYLRCFSRATLGTLTKTMGVAAQQPAQDSGKCVDLDPTVRAHIPWLDGIALYKFRDDNHYGAIASPKRTRVASSGVVHLILEGDDDSRAELSLSPERLRGTFSGCLPAQWERLTLRVVADTCAQ